jgi:hypothetical protein
MTRPTRCSSRMGALCFGDLGLLSGCSGVLTAPSTVAPSFLGLPTRPAVIAGGPHPPAELVTTAARPEQGSSSPAVPPTCPKQRFAAVIHGQPRFMPMPAELYDHLVRSWPRELPKLAVPSTRGRSAGDGDQFSRCRAPGHAASGWSHRARPATPRRSTLLRDTPQSRRSSAGHGSSMA